MMFCNSDSVIRDIQHKEILYEIYIENNNQVNHRTREEENINEDHSEQTACMESHESTDEEE